MASMLAPGTTLLGKYRVERELGKGGMGVVVKAWHLHLGQPVAIKFLRASKLREKDVVKRFLREAQAAVRLQSEHVCTVFDVGTMDNGSPYMVMQFMDGLELGELARREQLSTATIVDLMLQACSALAEAHSLGIIHRDIKPANLFVTRRPDGTRLLKVLDFGISKAPVTTDTQLTNTQTVLGTPSYMPPEQMRSSKNVDARSDIWALGVVLFELLAGHRPFQGHAFSELCLQVGMDPTPPLDVPVAKELKDAIYRCLEKEPGGRFQNVAQLAAALAPHASGQRAATGIVESASRTLGLNTLADTLVTSDLVRPPVLDTGGANPVAGPAPASLSTLGGEGVGELRKTRETRRVRLIAGLALLGIAVTAAVAFTIFAGRSGTSDTDNRAAGAPASAASVPATATGGPTTLPAPIIPEQAAPITPKQAAPTVEAPGRDDKTSTAAADDAAASDRTDAAARAEAAAKAAAEKRRARRKARRERRKRNARKAAESGKSADRSDRDEIFGSRE